MINATRLQIKQPQRINTYNKPEPQIKQQTLPTNTDISKLSIMRPNNVNIQYTRPAESKKINPDQIKKIFQLSIPHIITFFATKSLAKVAGAVTQQVMVNLIENNPELKEHPNLRKFVDTLPYITRKFVEKAIDNENLIEHAELDVISSILQTKGYDDLKRLTAQAKEKMINSNNPLLRKHADEIESFALGFGATLLKEVAYYAKAKDKNKFLMDLTKQATLNGITDFAKTYMDKRKPQKPTH